MIVAIFAFAWLFLVKSKDGPPLQLVDNIGWVLGLELLCIVALALDFFQYLFGWLNASALFNRAQSQEIDQLQYDEGAWLYQARYRCFNLKIVALLLAAAWLIWLVTRAIVLQ